MALQAIALARTLLYSPSGPVEYYTCSVKVYRPCLSEVFQVYFRVLLTQCDILQVHCYVY